MENLVLGSSNKDELSLVERVIKSFSRDLMVYFSEIPDPQTTPLTNFDDIAGNAKEKASFAKKEKPECIAVAFSTGVEDREDYNAVTYEFEPYTLFIGVAVVMTPDGKEILCSTETISAEKEFAELCRESLSSALLYVM